MRLSFTGRYTKQHADWFLQCKKTRAITAIQVLPCSNTRFLRARAAARPIAIATGLVTGFPLRDTVWIVFFQGANSTWRRTIIFVWSYLKGIPPRDGVTEANGQVIPISWFGLVVWWLDGGLVVWWFGGLTVVSHLPSVQFQIQTTNKGLPETTMSCRMGLAFLSWYLFFAVFKGPPLRHFGGGPTPTFHLPNICLFSPIGLTGNLLYHYWKHGLFFQGATAPQMEATKNQLAELAGVPSLFFQGPPKGPPLRPFWGSNPQGKKTRRRGGLVRSPGARGKLKGLEKESHKRERSLARAAARAGGGELGLLTLDGNRRAKQEASGSQFCGPSGSLGCFLFFFRLV